MNFTLSKSDEDSLLIQKIKCGDSSAIEDFIRKYYPDILKYCERRTSSKEDAMDLTQEVFMRFFSLPQRLKKVTEQRGTFIFEHVFDNFCFMVKSVHLEQVCH